MAAQEIHYASMAQVVEPSSLDSIVMRESKKLWSMVASQARIAPSVWMTEYHRQQLGGARMWVNLIRITVPAVTGNDTPVYHDHHMALYDYHRDLNSAITLETNASISEFDQKTWGFLIYPEDADAENTTFGALMKRVLVGGILPLTRHYFQGFFLTSGTSSSGLLSTNP
jgi:hypothetical protein